MRGKEEKRVRRRRKERRINWLRPKPMMQILRERRGRCGKGAGQCLKMRKRQEDKKT